MSLPSTEKCRSTEDPLGTKKNACNSVASSSKDRRPFPLSSTSPSKRLFSPAVVEAHGGRCKDGAKMRSRAANSTYLFAEIQNALEDAKMGIDFSVRFEDLRRE